MEQFGLNDNVNFLIVFSLFHRENEVKLVHLGDLGQMETLDLLDWTGVLVREEVLDNQ